MSLTHAIIIAIVEGLTEFLPVSSTGHIILTQSLLGIESTGFARAFTVIIQFGAILSVVCLYWKRFFGTNPGKVFDIKSLLKKYDFYYKLLIAFLPAAIIGLLFGEWIDSLLDNVWVVAVMLIAGGGVMLFVDRLFGRQSDSGEISAKQAFNVGLFQCIAMIPGVSRSMATIVGGMAQKISRKEAAEFSFFLAVPTLFAATAYKLYQLISLPNGMELISQNAAALAVGLIVSFAVALAAIRFFIGYITRYGFKAFGYYRILAGGIILALLSAGHNLSV